MILYIFAAFILGAAVVMLALWFRDCQLLATIQEQRKAISLYRNRNDRLVEAIAANAGMRLALPLEEDFIPQEMKQAAPSFFKGLFARQKIATVPEWTKEKAK